MSGLGDSQTITVTTSGNATAVYACQNNGGNFPSDPKKTTVSGPVSASGGQHVVLVSVSYSNVQVSSPGVGTVSLGTFSRTFFNI